ncbi:MAG: diguanylate cyclase [Thermodesulfobacterium sp.]|nr:diguanylate cyclase [Thermodesulfobacterium sp.]
MKNYSFKFENKKINFTISIGVTLYSQDGKDVFSLLKNAEIALQMAKKEGKFKWVFFEK